MLDRIGSRWSADAAARAALLAGALLGWLGCASTRPEAVLPPQSLVVERTNAPPEAPPSEIAPLEPIATEPFPSEESPFAAAPAPIPAAEPAPPAASDSRASISAADANDDSVVVIDHSDAAGQEDTRSLLRDLSRSERERRQAAPTPRLVLNDDNLAAHAEGARVTFSGPGAGSVANESASAQAPGGANAAAATAAEPGGSATVDDDQDAEERYWRSRALDVRQRWRRAYDDVPRLEGEVERLRTAFYSEDDPVRRDRQIKPLWDRAIDRLQEAQDEVESTREELGIVLAEGKAAGVPDGWLREGNELEPPIEAVDAEGEQLDEANPDEPVSAEPVSREPPRR
jgi:hypothetical protein